MDGMLKLLPSIRAPIYWCCVTLKYFTWPKMYQTSVLLQKQCLMLPTSDIYIRGVKKTMNQVLLKEMEESSF